MWTRDGRRRPISYLDPEALTRIFQAKVLDRWVGEHRLRPEFAARLRTWRHRGFQVYRAESVALDSLPDGPKTPQYPPAWDNKTTISEQARQLEQIVGACHQRFIALRNDYKPPCGRIIDDTISEIRAILTPEQNRLYDRYLKKHRQWKN